MRLHMMDLDPMIPVLSNLRPSEQVVLIQLYLHKINNDTHASQNHLISWTGIKSPNTIKTAIKGLIQQGLVKCLKAGQQNAPALYRLCLDEPSKPNPPELVPEVSPLSNDNRLRLAAIKKGFSPAKWQEVRREAQDAGITEDTYILQSYFGPARIHGE